MNTNTRSITTEPLLLTTERLHRVDASQLPHGAGVSLGHCRTDLENQTSQGCHGECNQGRRCTCASSSSPAAPHTEPDVPESERDPILRAWVWGVYLTLLLALGWISWPWLVNAIQ